MEIKEKKMRIVTVYTDNEETEELGNLKPGEFFKEGSLLFMRLEDIGEPPVLRCWDISQSCIRKLGRDRKVIPLAGTLSLQPASKPRTG